MRLKSGFIILSQIFARKYPIGVFIYYHFLRGRQKNLLQQLLKNHDIRKQYKSNCFVPIRLEDSLYMEQTTHPDVIQVKRGNVDMIIMAVTAYPFGDDRYENPCIYESMDGLYFYDQFRNNPVAEYKKINGRSHLSDTDLIFAKNEYWLYYRDCVKTDAENHNIIRRLKSSNLSKWNRQEIALKGMEDEVISPAVMELDGLYYMYYITFQGDKGIMKRRVSADGLFGDSMEEVLRVFQIPKGKKLWHIDIISDNGIIHCLFTLSEGEKGLNTRLYYGYSKDHGETWYIGKEIKVCENTEKHFIKIYRASMTRFQGTWYLYISVMTKRRSWYTYLLKNFHPELYKYSLNDNQI